MELNMTQKVIAGVVTTAIVWTAYTTQSTALQVAVMDAKLTAVAEERYRASDASRDLALRDQRINSIAERVTELERLARWWSGAHSPFGAQPRV